MSLRRHQPPSHSWPLVSEGMIRAVRAHSLPLRSPDDLAPLMDRIGDARFVLIGEATHGTGEYYTWRAALSQRLIAEKGFSFVAVEGDWPDCYRVNRYVKAEPGAGATARDVLHAFDRWPTWMWANEEVVAFTEWLRQHNEGVPEARRVGFYGLDVYSLWASLHRVLDHLRKRRPASLPAALQAFKCFARYGEDAHDYARATRWLDETCEGEVVSLLTELRRAARPASPEGREALFDAEQNALVVQNAEHYYRTMVRGRSDSWNIRDRHMAETLERLMHHHADGARAIVWEHNTHIGDARFTDMADDGMVNVGQLARERHGEADVVLVGFGSYAGRVIAGEAWEAPMQEMRVPPAHPGSWEDVLHRAGLSSHLLLLDRLRDDDDALAERGHRAIGVVYDPRRERYGNYVPTVLPRRYDAFIYLDQTRALRPLHDVWARADGEVPETYPSGV